MKNGFSDDDQKSVSGIDHVCLIRKRITTLKIGGIILGLAGVLGLILHKQHISLDSGNFMGDLFIFLIKHPM